MNATLDRSGRTKTPVPRYAWVILAVVFLASLAAPLNFVKAPGIATTLMPYFGIWVEEFGWIMAIFSVMGIILAFPAGFIMQRFGVKRVVLLSVGCCFVGSTMGALSTEFSLLLASRFIEGVGNSIIFVAAPAALIAWFPSERQGVALGVWGTCMPFGTFLMLNIAPTLTNQYGWQSVWWFGSAVAAVAFLLYAAFFKMPVAPYSDEAKHVSHAENTNKTSIRELAMVLKVRDVWLAGFIFGCFNFVVATVINTYYPLFLETEVGLTNVVASSITGIPELLSIFGCPIVGLVADRLGAKKGLLVAGCIILGVTSSLVFFASSAPMAIILMACLGVFSPLVSTGVRLVIPEATGNDHLKAGMGNAVLSFWQNFVGLAGPVLAGFFVVNVGWVETGLWLFAPLFVLALIASVLIRSGKRAAQARAETFRKRST